MIEAASNHEVHLPSKEEHKLLGDMDAQITALEPRHTKTRALDQAMM